MRRKSKLMAWIAPGAFVLLASGAAFAGWDFGMDPSEPSAYGTEEGTETGDILREPGIAPLEEELAPPESSEPEMKEGTDAGTIPEEFSPSLPESSEEDMQEETETGTLPESEIVPEEQPSEEGPPWTPFLE